MFNIIFLFLTYLFGNSYVHAKEPVYFDFYFDNNTLSGTNEVNVGIKYNLDSNISNERFKVRALSDKGSIDFVLEGSYVDSNDFWTAMPYLTKNLNLRIKGNFHSAYVWFEILDLKTGKIYKTPKHLILSRAWYKRYINLLNQNILKLSEVLK